MENQMNKKIDSKFNVVKKSKLPVKYKGKNAMRYAYKGKFSRNEIKNYADKLSKELKQQNFNGAIGVSLHTVDGYRGAMFRPTGSPVRMYSITDSPNYDNSDQEFYNGFSIILFNTLPRHGGKDPNNDCLYNALKLAMGNDIPWKTPTALKNFLKVNRNAMIHMNDIKKIDDKIKQYKIMVTGDDTYTSTKNCQRTIHINLFDEHYTLDQSKKGYSLNVNFKEKKPVICFINGEHVETYDGVEKKIITHKEYYKFTKCNNTPYIYVSVNRARQKVCDRKTIEEEYKLFIDKADNLKEKSKGMINLYKTGTNQLTALNLFDRYTKAISPEDIEQDESYWTECSTMGALIRCQTYEGQAYKYDVVSMYPSILKDSKFLIPIKRGEFKKLDEVPEIFAYGIYRVNIEYNKEKEKIFRYNRLNYYTHHCIRFAQSLGLEVTLIQDDKPNALIYTRDKCITSNQVFSEYIDFLFNLKKDGVEGAKDILNIIWGALCEYKTRNKTATQDKEIDISGDNYIHSLCPLDDNDTILLKVYQSKRVYTTNYARLGPFLLARGRMMIGQLLCNNINDVVRIHTDGWIQKTEFKSNKIGDDIGQVRFEGYSDKCIVRNCIYYDFD
jgi:hypothetical protein